MDTNEEQQAHFILCRQSALDDGCIYDHNVSVYQSDTIHVIKCPSRWFADYQRGRVHSGYWWVAPVPDGPFESQTTAQAAADEAAQIMATFKH